MIAMAASPLLLLLRGPILVTAVVFALFYPSLSQVSVETWIWLTILGLGLALTVSDVFAFVFHQLRSTVRRHTRSIVLDDVLRAIFDKEGIIALVMSTMVGNATLYNFGNPEQRVRLVGSCLEKNEEDARTILMAPGGVVKLFPDSVQGWLDDNSIEIQLNPGSKEKETPITEQQAKHIERPLHGDEDSDSTSNESDTETEPCPNEINTIKGDKSSLRSSARSCTERSSRPLPRAVPNVNLPEIQSPEDVVASVIKEIVLDRIKRVTASIPDHSIQMIGIVSSAALAVLLRSSSRTRQIMLGALQGTTAVSLAGVALGALAALATKRRLFEPERISGSGINSLNCSLLPIPLPRIWKAIQDARLVVTFRKWQGTLAMFILFVIGTLRKKRQ